MQIFKPMQQSTSRQITPLRPHAILHQLQVKKSDKLVFSTQEGLSLIPIQDIHYCAAQGNYCKVFMSSGKSLLISKPMKHIARFLPLQQFVRTHQSYVVSIEAITQIKEFIVLSGGTEIPVSRSRRPGLVSFIRQRYANV